MSGPLAGVRVVELAGLGPAPFAGMMLGDMGADVVRVDRVDARPDHGERRFDVMARGRRSIAVDLKQPAGVDVVLELVKGADALIEGFRPGVLERMGLGPGVLLERNPRLVVGRMTGWGQDGPLGNAAGHDLNYIALSGALHAIGSPGGPPVPPLNLVGDFGGGGMLLAYGVVCALLEARTSGQGQVIDAAMVDGAAALMNLIYGMHAGGTWQDRRGVNLVDGGAPFYGTYACRDGRHVAIGPIEPQFHAELLDRLGLSDDPAFARQYDRAQWPAMRARLEERFASRTRDEWCEVFEGSDACLAPGSPSPRRPDTRTTLRGARSCE